MQRPLLELDVVMKAGLIQNVKKTSKMGPVTGKGTF